MRILRLIPLAIVGMLSLGSYAQQSAVPPIQSVVPPADIVRAKIDPAYPPRVGAAYYPDYSKRHREQGKCVVRVAVDADGTVQDVSIVVSTGFPTLDQACLKAFKPGRLKPATQDGKPTATVQDMNVVWMLMK